MSFVSSSTPLKMSKIEINRTTNTTKNEKMYMKKSLVIDLIMNFPEEVFP